MAARKTTQRARVVKGAIRGALVGAVPGPIRGAVEGARRAARTPARTPKRRRNPALPLDLPIGDTSVGAVLMSRRVLAVAYEHVQSTTHAAYNHDFARNGVELYALEDGSLLIRHPRLRLWADFTVKDSE